MFTENQLRMGLTDNLLAYKQLAENEFNDRVEHMVKVNEYLTNKPFKLGQVVVVKCFERITPEREYKYVDKFGIVIRHGIPDGHGDYYRIHFDEKDKFSAENEDKIRALRDDEDIPEHLSTYVVHWCAGDYTGVIMSFKTFK